MVLNLLPLRTSDLEGTECSQMLFLGNNIHYYCQHPKIQAT